MKLQEFVDRWQTLLDKYPARSRGWLASRVDLVRQYQTPLGVYQIQAPDNDNNFHLTYIRNNSVISDTSAKVLYNYATERLVALTEGFEHLFDCELLPDDQGSFIASFYSPFGGRLTVHGIKMTKNRAGVVSDEGVIAQC